MRINSLTQAAGLCIAATAVTATAQPQVAAFGAFQSWNAANDTAGRQAGTWISEGITINPSDGLRWDWWELDGMMNVVDPTAVPVIDAAVPGITDAYQFPAARAASIKPDGTGNRGTNWENQAPVNGSGSLEIWFKPSDLTGQHVLWEIGATNKGAGFVLDGNELVFFAAGNNGATGNTFATSYRHTLSGTDWVQAVLVINFTDFIIESWVNGVMVDSQSITAATNYRWSSGNPAGLGQVGSDPMFPLAGVGGDPVDPAMFTDYDGMIAIHRFYNADLFPDEIEDNYDAITDAAAMLRRTDFNGDGMTNGADQFDYITAASMATTAPHGGLTFPFPGSPGGGVQTNDPADDEERLGDRIAQIDAGFNPNGQEPSYQFDDGVLLNPLGPTSVLDAASPAVRASWTLNGSEGLRGPKLEQAEDTSATRVEFWMHFDDVAGTHCLYEAGGGGSGFSLYSVGDQLIGGINTRADIKAMAGPDEVTVTSATGVLTPGWHKLEIIVRRFAGDIGQGFEIYLDGAQVAAINDDPGPDMMFGTADDIDNFDPDSGTTNNYIGGNQSGYGHVQGSAYVPTGVGADTPFNGLAGPIRVIQTQPTPAEVMAQYMTEISQEAYNARLDSDDSGGWDIFDVLFDLKVIDAGM